MCGRGAQRLLLIVAFALMGSNGSWAVTDEEIFRDFRFNFINPGGRSLGMGGAFISIANDATAAQANPACLTNLPEPQFFSEVRSISSDPVTTERTFRDPLDEGFDLSVTTNPDTVVSPSFLSYVYPWRKIWIGVSRQEVINIENETTNTFDFIFTAGDDSRTGEGDIDLLLTNWNVSVGFKPHERFRLGVTASYGNMSTDSVIVNTYTDPTGDVIGDPNLAGTSIEMYRTEFDDSDSDLTFTAGLLWSIIDSVSVGAVYRQGGDFSLQGTLIGQPIDPSLVPGQIAERVFVNESDTLLTTANNVYTFSNEFHIPDVIGAGVAWSPIDVLTLALDAVHIEYSDLLNDFNSRLNVLTFGFQEDAEASFTVDDQTNLAFGAEYDFDRASGLNWLVRAGYHQDKDNRIRADFEPGGFGLGENENFPGRDDEDHYSAGVGITVGEPFQLDIGGDFSDLGTEIVVSFIYSFGVR